MQGSKFSRVVRHFADRGARLRGPVCLALILGLAAPAFAMSVKSLMAEMRDTTRQAKAVAASFQVDAARSVLSEYAQQAKAGADLLAGRADGNARDMRARFLHMASTAVAANSSVTDKASFRHAFAAIAESCRSCHSLYK